MKSKLGRFLAIAFAITMIAPLALAGYSSPQYRMAEPSTPYDVGNMSDETDALSGDHAYLNGYPTIYALGPSPTLTDADSTTPPQMLYFNAMMGFWRDCNNDGFIGSAALGMEVYPVSLLDNTDICPPGDGPTGNAYYVNPAGDGFVNEFLWIGPDRYWNEENQERTNEAGHTDIYEDYGVVGPSLESSNDPRNVNDQEAKVWGDLGLPDSKPAATAALFPFPKGSLMTWERNLGLVDLYFDVEETLSPYGLSYEPVLEAGRTLDGAGVPTPLGIVKDLYNSSTEPDGGQADCGRGTDCEGAYAQPFITVWDCQKAEQGTYLGPVPNPATGDDEYVYVAPPVSVGPVNEDGTVTGTYYQFMRGVPEIPDPTGGNIRSGYGDREGDDNVPECHDGTSPSPTYSNLERTSAVGVDTPKKTDTDVEFYYYPQSRIHEAPENDPRRGSSGNVTVPYTGLVDGADRHAGTGHGSLYIRGWKAGVIYVSIPSATAGPGNLQEFHGTSTTTFYGYSSLTVGEFPMDANYGDIHCPNGFGAGLTPEDGTWECDPDHPDWQDHYNDSPRWNVVVGHPYNLRDVDCYDNTFAGVTTPRAPGVGPFSAGNTCEDRGLTVE